MQMFCYLKETMERRLPQYMECFMEASKDCCADKVCSSTCGMSKRRYRRRKHIEDYKADKKHGWLWPYRKPPTQKDAIMMKQRLPFID